MAETRIGRERFLAFVVGVTLAGAAAHLAARSVPALARLSSARLDGWGTITTASLLFVAGREPRLRMELGFFGIPAWAFAALWMGVDVLGALRVIRGIEPQIWGHAGGALFALAAARFGIVPDPSSWFRTRRSAGPPPARRDDEQARVDALLDKIGREGMAALSDEERAFLNRASKRYR
jgi:membrane associated rhomboid family serine protease